MVDQGRVCSIERQAVSELRRGSSRRWQNLGKRRKLPGADFRLVQTLFDQRYAVGRRRIRHDFADPQMIILKDIVTTALLSLVVLGDGAPSHNGLFVSPCGMRQDPPRPTRAFEALVVDEPVDALQDRLQVFRKSEVKLELLFLGMDFEDHREHLDHPACLRFVPGGGDVFLPPDGPKPGQGPEDQVCDRCSLP